MLNNEINDKKAQEMKKENYKKYVKQKTPEPEVRLLCIHSVW